MQLEKLKEIIGSVIDEKLAERTFTCRNSDCIENCGVSRHEHRAHHELVAEIRKDRDSLIEKMKFVHKLMKGKEATTKIIGETIERQIKNTPGRILIATFATNIGRIIQIVNSAIKHNRVVFLS